MRQDRSAKSRYPVLIQAKRYHRKICRLAFNTQFAPCQVEYRISKVIFTLFPSSFRGEGHYYQFDEAGESGDDGTILASLVLRHVCRCRKP